MEPYFASMANAQAVAFGPEVAAPPLNAHIAAAGMDVYVDLADLIDVPAEITRKKQDVEKLTGFISAKEKKLTNRELYRPCPGRRGSKKRDSLKDLQDQLAAAQEVLERLATAK